MGRGVTATAALGGFLLGATVATTALLALYVHLKRKEGEDEDEDYDNELGEEEEGDLQSSLRRSRGLGGSAVSRSSVAAALVSDESGDNFLTCLIRELWPHLNVALCEMIRETVEPTLAESLPSPMNTLKFTKLNLGKSPPKIENLVVHDNDEQANPDDPVQFDFDLVWKSGRGCNITLKTASYGLTLGVEKFALTGHMTFLAHPSDEIPCVSSLQYAFINTPSMNLDFTGLAELADIKSIKRIVIDSILSTLNEMMVLPHRSLYKMDYACSLMDVYRPPIGIARVTLLSGRGFQVEKRMLRSDDIPDVYCVTALGDSTWRSSTIKDNLEPKWDDSESCDFVFSDYHQVVTVNAWDEDGGPLDPDDDLGRAEIPLGRILLEAGRQVELDLLTEDYKKTGASIAFRVDVYPFCVGKLDLEQIGAVSAKDAASTALATTPAGKQDAKFSASMKKKVYGILEVLILKAYDLPLKKEDAASYVKVLVDYGGPDHAKEFVTSTVVDYPGIDALDPEYEASFLVPIHSGMLLENGGAGLVGSSVTLTLMNGIDPATAVVLGSTTVYHDLLMSAPGNEVTIRKGKIGDSGAKLEYRVTLRGVQEEPAEEGPTTATSKKALSTSVRGGSTTSSMASAQPTVRVTVISGKGFKVPKRRFLKKPDIPDPYCRVKFGSNPTIHRTKTCRNDVAPQWMESFDFPFRSQGEIVNLEVYDEDKGKRDPDDFIGGGRIAVGKLLLASPSKEIELRNKKDEPVGICLTLKAEIVSGTE